MQELSLAGKTALVTGGSRGLGRAMVLAFAEHGANVVIASRKLEACEELAKEVTHRFGHEALAVAANVSSWQDCDRLVEAAYERFGKVDVLSTTRGCRPATRALIRSQKRCTTEMLIGDVSSE